MLSLKEISKICNSFNDDDILPIFKDSQLVRLNIGQLRNELSKIITSSEVISALGFTPVDSARTITINGVSQNLTRDRTWTINSSDIITALGYTPLHTSNTGSEGDIALRSTSDNIIKYNSLFNIDSSDNLLFNGASTTINNSSNVLSLDSHAFITNVVHSGSYGNITIRDTGVKLYANASNIELNQDWIILDAQGNPTYPIGRYGSADANFTSSNPANDNSYILLSENGDDPSNIVRSDLTTTGNYLNLQIGGSPYRAYQTIATSDITNLSSWAGSSSIVTLGTITSGIWHGTAIADTYISSASTWNAKQNALGYTPENIVNKGVANGYASLDSSGYVPLSQTNPSLLGALDYQGVWNANTNSPTLVSSTGTKGYYYKVSISGTTTTIDGTSVWNIGDWIAFNGTIWDKVDNNELVSSVVGQTGAITVAQIISAINLTLNATSGSFSLGSTGILTMPDAATSTRGLLNSTDWNTFNNKINLTSLSSSVTGLTYTNTTGVFSLTSGYAIPTSSQLSSYLTANQTITLSSDITGSGTTSITATIASNAVTLAKMAQITTASFLGRNAASTGNVEVLSAGTTKTILSLNNVENTALSTWAGSSNITTLGTIASGFNVAFTQNTANTPLAVITNNGTGNSSVFAVNAGSTGNPNIGFQVSGTAKATLSWNISANTFGIGNLAYSPNDFGFKLPSDGSLQFVDGSTSAQRFLVTSAGKVKVGTSTPTALLHIAAGTASANTSPLKLTSGTNLTSPEAGAIEFNGTNYFFTRSTTREVVWTGTTGVSAPSTQTLVSLPLMTYGAGTITAVLGTPDGWCTINDNGTLRKVPYYN